MNAATTTGVRGIANDRGGPAGVDGAPDAKRPATTFLTHVSEASSRLVRTFVARELDDYAESFGYRAVRLGLGSGPNVHRQLAYDGVTVQSGAIGFPVAGEKTIPDDQFVVALSVCGPPGTRWSEHHFAAGTMLSFGPRSEATWVNPEGVLVQIAFIDQLAVQSMAESLKVRVRLPEPGAVRSVSETTSARRLGLMLASFGNPVDASVACPDSPTELLLAATHVMTEDARRSPAAKSRRIDGRRLVRTCVDYADEVGARPSIPELCAIANVSERRLRHAFNDAFDMSPVAYFRLRSLNLARRRLLQPETVSVTDVAFELGWTNLGRFAQCYSRVFRELPSQTVAAVRPRAQPTTASTSDA